MRWDNLFDDLEGQLEQGLGAEEVDLRAEEERLRLGRMTLRDRIASLHAAESRHSAYSVRLELLGGHHVEVRPVAVGKDWCSADLVGDGVPSAQCVIPLDSVTGILLTGRQTGQTLRDPVPDRALSARLTLSFVLRDLCRRRSNLEIRLVDGAVFGTIDRVGRDHFDLAVHEPGSARREGAVTGYRIVPFRQVVLVRL